MKKVLYIFIPILLFLIAIIYFTIPVFFAESYFPLYPHIDTRFANGFEIENFEKINIGMSKTEVENLIGKPLLFSQKMTSSLQPENSCISVYTSDGKSNWSDFAWESFDIYFDNKNVVIGKSRRWWKD